MPFIVSSSNGTARGIFSGEVNRCDPDDYAVRTRMFLPPGVSAMARYCSARLYASRLYLVGHFTENVLLDEHYRLLRQGTRPPTSPPTVTPSAGTTEQICYLSFWDELTGERSSLSEGATITGGLTRTWANLPTSVPGEILRAEGIVNIAAGAVTGVGAPAKTNFDMVRPGDRILASGTANRWATIREITSSSAMTIDDAGLAAAGETLTYKMVSRMTHVECWVSVAGTLPRLAARVRLGTTTFVESVDTLSLGEAFLDNFEPMPVGTMNCIYGDRQLIAGVAGHEDEVFLSNLFFPERWGGLSFRTRYGEPIRGLIGADDYARVDGPESSYILQGYTEDDLTMTVSNPSLGSLGHFASVQVESNVWTPNRKNYYLFNGSWRPMCTDRNTEWNDSYRANPSAFERGFAVYNPNDATIQFYPLYGSGVLTHENVWVADFSSVKADAGGEYAQPYWMDDDYRSVPGGDAQTLYQAVSDYWGYAAYLIPDGRSVGKLYRVSFPGGQIYFEDDTVAFHRDAVLKTPHYLFAEESEDAGGDSEDHGWKLDTFWAFVRAELSAWKVGIWFGDEFAAEVVARGVINSSASNIAAPQWNEAFVDVAASLVEEVAGGAYNGQNVDYLRWAPKTTHFFRPMLDGRGLTAELRFSLPLDVRFFGLGGKCIPGRASRGVVLAELPGV